MSERTAVFGYVDESKLDETIARQQKKDNFSVDSISNGVPKFTQETGYTTFLAEYAMRDGDIVIHFFLPQDFKRGQAAARHYWENQFAVSLDAIAQQIFQATAPRLQAKYTEEMQSWWFRASRFDHVVDLDGFIRRFFDALDTDLERVLASDRPSRA